MIPHSVPVLMFHLLPALVLQRASSHARRGFSLVKQTALLWARSSFVFCVWRASLRGIQTPEISLDRPPKTW